MRELWTKIPPLTMPLVALLLSPAAMLLGVQLHWPAGIASLVLLVIPTCLAALSGRRWVAASTALVAAMGCVADAGFNLLRPEVESNWGLAMLSLGLLLGLSSMILGVIEPLRREIDRLEEVSTSQLRDLYRQVREEASSQQEVKLAETGEAALAEAIDDRRINFPMLLLTLQDAGRKIAGHLDLDTLVPTILSTTSQLLKASHAQLFYWNASTSTLKNALPVSRRDAYAHYVPQPDTGMVRWVLQNRHILTRKDISRDYALQGLLDEESLAPDAVAPVAVGGELLGLLVLHGVEQESPSFSRVLYIVTNISALALKNAQLFRRIEEMARRDGLTGLLNHASFQEQLSELASEATQQKRPLSIIMSDVDHFKKFNDTYGHQAGDLVLQEVARLWRAVMPDYAVIARYGGEEFIAALPDDDQSRAAELAELLRHTLEVTPLNFEGRELNVTASFGVAELHRGPHTIDDLVKVADECMYQAKKSGRNRVCSHSVTYPSTS